MAKLKCKICGYIMTFICKVCNFVLEEDKLPEDYKCPVCGIGAEHFKEQ